MIFYILVCGRFEKCISLVFLSPQLVISLCCSCYYNNLALSHMPDKHGCLEGECEIKSKNRCYWGGYDVKSSVLTQYFTPYQNYLLNSSLHDSYSGHSLQRDFTYIPECSFCYWLQYPNIYTVYSIPT
jgi:hypothetical protein